MGNKWTHLFKQNFFKDKKINKRISSIIYFLNYAIRIYREKKHLFYGLAKTKMKTKKKNETKYCIELVCLHPKLAFDSLFSSQEKPYKLIFTSATLPT